MPALGLGRVVSANGLQVDPPSPDHVSKTLIERERPIAWSRPSAWRRILGWMAWIGEAGGSTRVQVRALSREISKCTRQTELASGDSVLLPAMMVPSRSTSG